MLVKISLRDQVKVYLQEQMLNGTISFGQRISLPDLAIKLGVSVTPIREALAQLEQVKIVKAIPNRGFFLPQLNNSEILEVYPIIASLEHLAILESEYGTQDLSHLTIIQSQIESSTTPQQILKLDLEFHKVLLQNFSNNLLKSILNDLKIRVFLYEFYYMKDPDLAKMSSSYHRNVIASLEKNDVQKAAGLIKESWLTSIDFVQEQLE